MFRCPTCVTVLTDPSAKRCPTCGANLRRHPPQVLGQSARLTARLQPIDLRPFAISVGGARRDVDIDLTAAEAEEPTDVAEVAQVSEVAETSAAPAERSTGPGAA